jgi:hypothetical protein
MPSSALSFTQDYVLKRQAHTRVSRVRSEAGKYSQTAPQALRILTPNAFQFRNPDKLFSEFVADIARTIQLHFVKLMSVFTFSTTEE